MIACAPQGQIHSSADTDRLHLCKVFFHDRLPSSANNYFHIKDYRYDVQDRLRVLVVNDDRELLQSRCAVLSALGVDAVEALGVAQAHQMASQETYAAVLVDATNVSFQHAIDLCAAIKQEKPWQKVILLTRPHHVVSEDDCPDAIVVREHPERMIPNIVAAIRGDVPVDGELAPKDSS